MRASKRLLTTMNQHMSFQCARPIACVVALVAIVGLLSVIKRILGMFRKVAPLHFHTFLVKNILSSALQDRRIGLDN